MFRTRLNYVAFLLVSVMLSGCVGGSRKQVYVPAELLEDKDIYLGQSLSLLKKRREVRYDESDFSYYEKLADNQYFTTVSYNSGVNDIFWRSSVLEHISLGGRILEEPYSDSLAIEIIHKCDNVFGSDFVIVDADPYEHVKISKRPMLIWNADSCFVSLIYTPKPLYERLEKIQKVVPIGFALEISYELEDYKKAFKESSIWTRETLGLTSAGPAHSDSAQVESNH